MHTFGVTTCLFKVRKSCSIWTHTSLWEENHQELNYTLCFEYFFRCQSLSYFDCVSLMLFFEYMLQIVGKMKHMEECIRETKQEVRGWLFLCHIYKFIVATFKKFYVYKSLLSLFWLFGSTFCQSTKVLRHKRWGCMCA